ncbi:uncharacterized protein AKAME5_002060900 [Lates japonicus]|uniref:Uncharacterized protein n=1 Tax=Lates japonicus TaxID=270547 RepID=A0AAD3NAG3_LATJO|nr:uncharacterized protein AKAME5_002060900 [Lates japonicus]
MVVLFKNNEDQEASRTYECIGNRQSGSFDTSVPLNDGLQARLHKVRRLCCFWKVVGEEICRGTGFESPEAVSIRGYNASQLFVKMVAIAQEFKPRFHTQGEKVKSNTPLAG